MSPQPQTITLTRPDDMHLHVRDGQMLETVLPHTARQFARALIMPNLRPPVTTAEQAVAYRQRILQALPPGADFTPLMSLYLTDNTSAQEVILAKQAGVVAFKLYPAGATTNSDAGVTDIRKTHATLQAMQKHGLLLLIHGEVTDPQVDIFDREAQFIERVLIPLRNDFPELKIVLEHLTTRDGVDYVKSADSFVAATITPQHLLFNRNALFTGGIRPHYYCLPILKREEHRLALVQAATSGSPKFFLGTDSAPHLASLKEAAVGCAGCYSAFSALELYAQIFDEVAKIERLEAFASHFGADFYGLPRNTGTVTLKKEPWTVPESIPVQHSAAQLKPLCGESQLNWQIQP